MKIHLSLSLSLLLLLFLAERNGTERVCEHYEARAGAYNGFKKEPQLQPMGATSLNHWREFGSRIQMRVERMAAQTAR